MTQKINAGVFLIIVDGCNDGGADIILSDPDSENCDLVIGQSKFCKRISKDEIFNALIKMASFYKEMKAGHYEQVNSRVQSHRENLTQRISKNKFLRNLQIQTR